MDYPNEHTLVWRIKRLLDFMSGYIFLAVFCIGSFLWLEGAVFLWPRARPTLLPIDAITAPATVPAATEGTFAGLRMAFHGRGIIEITGARLDWTLLSFVYVLGMLLGTFVIIRMLAGIFSDLVENEPFSSENHRRVRTIGLMVIGLTIFSAAARLTCCLMIPAGSLAALGLRLTFNPLRSLPGLLIGFILIALAEVFRVGAALRQEQEQTV